MAAEPREGDVVLLVGTMKGAFLVWSGADRGEWRIEGPHFRGESVYALAMDQRGGRRRMLAATRSMHWGAVIRASDDFGATWSEPDRQNVRFPEGSGDALVNVWQIRPGRASEPTCSTAAWSPRRSSSRATRGRAGPPSRGC